MANSKLYLCPACTKVISANLSSGESLECPECGEEVIKSKEVSRDEGGPVSRDVMKQIREGVSPTDSKPEVKFDKKLPIRSKAKKKTGGKSEGKGEGKIRARRTRRKKRMSKGKRVLLKCFLGWLVLIGLVVAGAKFFQGQEPDFSAGESARTAEELVLARKQEFLERNGRSAMEHAKRYLMAHDPFARQDFVLEPMEIARKFARYHEVNNVQTLQAGFKVLGSGVVETALGSGVELLWVDPEGEMMETVSFLVDGEWGVDWEQNVRFSEFPWSLFISQVAGNEGEFRVYARRMAFEDETEQLRIMLYSPWKLGETLDSHDLGNRASPSIVVSRESEIGKRLLAAFSERQNEERLGSAFRVNDRDGYIRLTARLRWESEGEDEAKLVIAEVFSTDWLGEAVREAEAAKAIAEVDSEGTSDENLAEMEIDFRFGESEGEATE